MHGQGKAHDGGEEVRHGLYSEGAAAGLGKALGNRQAQAGAAIRAALVTPHNRAVKSTPSGSSLREVLRREATAALPVVFRER